MVLMQSTHSPSAVHSLSLDSPSAVHSLTGLTQCSALTHWTHLVEGLRPLYDEVVRLLLQPLLEQRLILLEELHDQATVNRATIILK